MNAALQTEQAERPLEVELLLTEDQRRPLTVAAHHEFRESLTHVRHDEIDELVAELRAVESQLEASRP